MAYRPDEDISEHVLEEHGAMINREQVNDPIDNIVEDDGTNTLIHDSFNVRMDDENDDDNENNDEFDDVLDIPILDKAYKPLSEGSKRNFISTILLIMNLKVMNGLSNIYITQMLRYVK